VLEQVVKRYDGRIGAIQFSNRLVDRSQLSKDSLVEAGIEGSDLVQPERVF
jgi:hypothetical protein